MKILKILSLAGALVTASLALWELTAGVIAVIHVYGIIIPTELSGRWMFVPVVAAISLLLLMHKKITLWEHILRPLWLLAGVFIWPGLGIGVFCYAMVILGWSAWRGGRLCKGYIRRIPEFSEKFSLLTVGIVSILLLWWLWYMQCSAFDGLYLIFGDWGQYTEAYMRLAHGGFSIKELLCSAGHFNPLINCIMSAAMFIYPSERTIFFINAIVIVSAVPLSYLLAKSNGLKSNSALLCALLAGVYPVFTRQTTALFYGFHPIVFFIPAVLGFFIARSKGSHLYMWIFFALSLLIQETVAVFWGGWGLYNIVVMRRYRTGIFMIAALMVWFAFLILLVQPWAAGSAAYGQSFHYASLGNSPVEIALSPFTKPDVFWGNLLSLRNALFAAILITPVLCGVVTFPGMLTVGIPIAGGFFMQSSEEIKTPLLQYGVELGTLLWCMTIINLGRLKKGEKPWFKGRRGAYYGAITAVSVCVAAGYIFFGFGFKFGIYPGEKCIHKPDALQVIAYLKKTLPENPERVLLPERLLAHFMFDYKIAKVSENYKNGDWLIIDMHDPVFESAEKVESLRRKLYCDPACRPVTQANFDGKQLVLIHIAEPGTKHFITPVRMSEAQFKKVAGFNVNSGISTVEAKYDGRMLHFRLKETPDVDYELNIETYFPDGTRKKFVYPWYYGLFPAWAQKPGTMWSLQLPSGIERCAFIFKARPESAAPPTWAGQVSSNPPASER